MSQDRTSTFEDARGLLHAVAYRILGQVADTEDVLQEAWLRWEKVDEEVRDPEAYLVTVTTRLAIDRLRRVQARREEYVGPWLPEPVRTEFITAPEDDPAAAAALADTVSFALLVVLESLSPAERAVFVLREAFAYPYAEIATILDRREDAVRQMATRARQHVAAAQSRFPANVSTHRAVTERFLAAAMGGDLSALLDVLAPDVTLTGDSGGQAKAPRRVLHGADKIAGFLVGIASDPIAVQLTTEIAELNGRPAVLATVSGRPIVAILLDVSDGGQVTALHLVANPDKLARLADR